MLWLPSEDFAIGNGESRGGAGIAPGLTGTIRGARKRGSHEALALQFGSADTINLVEEREVYSVIGHEGFERLVAAFYR